MSILFGCELPCCFDVSCYEIFPYTAAPAGNFAKMGFFVLVIVTSLVEHFEWSTSSLKIPGLCIVTFIA